MSEHNIPTGWKQAKISDISIKGLQRKPAIDESFIYVDIGSIDRNLKKISNPQMISGNNAPSRARKIIENGDVLISLTRPNLNAVALVDEKYHEQIASTGFEVIKPVLVDSRYIFALVRSKQFVDQISGVVQGALYPAAKSSDVQNFELSLPPLTEQKVIADKLDTLLAQVENTKARLERIPQILKRFRQSVLAAAVSGRLTEEWRTENQVQSTWKSTPFSELLLRLRSGAADKPNNDPKGIPILRSSAVRPLEIDFSDIRYLAKPDQLKKDNYLKQGDLLFTRLSGSAEYVGNCAMVRGIDRQYQFPDRLFCARLKEPRYGRFLEYFCASLKFREHIHSSLKSSAGHQRITLDVIRAATVALPPLSEQTQIVRRVDQLFAHADRIEQQVNNALARVNNLTQSILAKAFRGELTEQWRKDNPELISGENSAEALLERIKAERAAVVAKPKRRKAEHK